MSPCVVSESPEDCSDQPMVFESASDVVVREARDAMNGLGYSPLSRISLDYVDGVLFLEGTLGSYFLKQLAQSAVSRIDGVDRIENRIRVRRTVHLDRPALSVENLTERIVEAQTVLAYA